MGGLIRISAARALLPGAPEGVLDDLLAGRPRSPEVRRRIEGPSRPKGVGAGAWRRMSRLARLAVAAATPLLIDRPDRAEIPVIWGSAIGELASTSSFLDRLFLEGPERASPLYFQRSVYNAPAGLLSIALGLRGPSETVSAGGATGLMALLRGIDLLRLGRAQAALVMAGDDLNPTIERSWDLLGAPPPLGEAVAAVLIEVGGEGPAVSVRAGAHPPDKGLIFSRRHALPGRASPPAVPGAIPPEKALGLSPSMGLAVVAALVERGGAVIDWDGDAALTAQVDCL